MKLMKRMKPVRAILMNESENEKLLNLNYNELLKSVPSEKTLLNVCKSLAMPIMLPHANNIDELPPYMVQLIKKLRIKNALEGKEPEYTPDVELVAYLTCASLEAPLNGDMAHAFFALAASTFPTTLAKVMEADGIPTGPLTPDQRELVEKMRREITASKKKHINTKKLAEFINTLKGEES